MTIELPTGAVPSPMALDLVDVQGRLVRSLADAPAAPGAQQFAWDGRDAPGIRVSGGVYAFVLQVRGQRVSRRVVVAS